MTGGSPVEMAQGVADKIEARLRVLPRHLAPRLRGRIHQAAVPVSLLAGAGLYLAASSGARRSAVLVYGISLAVLFAVSACYHRAPVGDRLRSVLRRADHSTILIFIAGTFTPLAVGVTNGFTRWLLLGVVWGAAFAGIVIRQLMQQAPPGATAIVYAAVGLSAASVLPAILHRTGASAFVLVLLGGVVYLVGAVVYAKQRPDPRPSVFGYHEVFHALTVLAAALQYAGVGLVILTTPG
jgi:hemolysin III